MRFAGWLCLVLGVVCLCAATGLGIVAIQQATEISAYNHARPCPAGAAPNADCLRTVAGSVVAVTEYPGADRIPADYALDVRTASGTLHLRFNGDSPMLGYAVDGNPAVVTMWHGRPVSVSTDGRSAVTTSVPEIALAHDLGNGEETGGIGVFFVLGALALRRNRKAGGMQPVTSPVVAAAVLALFLGGIVVAFGGFALGGKPSRLGPDLAATGLALAVILGLSVWLGLSVKRRVKQSLASQPPASRTWEHDVASATHDLHAPVRPDAVVTRRLRPPLRMRMRMHPANIASVLGTIAAVWLGPTLTVAVLFGVFFTSHDGPASRAYRQAPACAGETNLYTCAGNFTAVINGVRSPANGANGADVSYVTEDGDINTWASFGGNSAAVTRMASADEHAGTLLTIRVWRGSIVGADFGGSWHWTFGNPPGNTIPTIFLAGGFALLLLVVRLRIHRRARSTANTRRLLVDDLGQVVAAVCSVVLLAYGFWPGAVLALATLVWLALSARQSARRRRGHLASQHAS